MVFIYLVVRFRSDGSVSLCLGNEATIFQLFENKFWHLANLISGLYLDGFLQFRAIDSALGPSAAKKE